MTSKWIPETDLLALRRLGKTIEELGELVAVLGRSVCQGIDGIDPSSGESNIERMTKESADVLTQIRCNIAAFELSQQAIDLRIEDKSQKMAAWEAMFDPVADKAKPDCIVDHVGSSHGTGPNDTTVIVVKSANTKVLTKGTRLFSELKP